jgi:hypothetical protein
MKLLVPENISSAEIHKRLPALFNNDDDDDDDDDPMSVGRIF